MFCTQPERSHVTRPLNLAFPADACSTRKTADCASKLVGSAFFVSCYIASALWRTTEPELTSTAAAPHVWILPVTRARLAVKVTSV